MTPLRFPPGLRLPAVWALLLTALFAVPFATITWPFIDLYSHLLAAAGVSWRDAVRQAFLSGIEYRPLLTLSLKLAFETVGLNLWFYKGIVLLQFAGILAVLLLILAPRTRAAGIAAMIALSCVAGLHTSRILFYFGPMNAHSGVLLLVLFAALLACTPGARRHEWVYFPLSLVAVLFLESGLLMGAALAALWLARAPGISARGVAAAVAGALVYIFIRVQFSAVLPGTAAYSHTGLGFEGLPPERLDEIFQHAPWLFWLYNVTATLLTVMLSEPRDGIYSFTQSLLAGNTTRWMWFHVLSSLATTVVVLFAVLSFGRMSPKERQVGATALALVVFGSALGFLYTRDRISLPVGVGYAMLLYLGLLALAQRADGAAWRKAVVATVAAALGAAWILRDAEMFCYLRDIAWENRREWSVRYTDILAGRPPTPLLDQLRTAALSVTPPDPRHDPAWTFEMFERKFERAPDGE